MTCFLQLFWAPRSLPLAHSTPAALAFAMFTIMSNCSCLRVLALAVPSASSPLVPDIPVAGALSSFSYLLNVTSSDKPSLMAHCTPAPALLRPQLYFI